MILGFASPIKVSTNLFPFTIEMVRFTYPLGKMYADATNFLFQRYRYSDDVSLE
jgi:hypothetical protein